MIHRWARVRSACLVVLVTQSPGDAQEVPAHGLGLPQLEYPGTFSSVRDVRELSDGRLIVLDATEPRLRLFAPDGSGGTAIGREGPGPGEYRDPGAVFPLLGDTSAILDDVGRFLVLSPEGALQGVLESQSSVSSCPSPSVPHQRPASRIDGHRRYYATGEPVEETGTGGWRLSDSAAVERWSGGCDRDTLGFIPNSIGTDGFVLAGFAARDGPEPPYHSRTEWGVWSDGRVVIVHPEPYRVEIIAADGQRRLGPVPPHRSVEVTDALRQAWRDEQRRPRPVRIRVRGGGTVTRIRTPAYEEPGRWPEYLPPFLPGALILSPAGDFWVRRTTPLGEPPVYDVFDALGRVTERVTLPPEARVVGLGEASVYVVRKGDLDLETLERYRAP